MAYNEAPPEWNESGVEPPQSKKNTGYQPGDKPPAQWWNWFMYRVYKVLAELQSKAAEKTDLTSHTGNTATGIHGSTSAATPSRLVHRDANGRAQVAAPSVAADIARKDTVDAAISAAASDASSKASAAQSAAISAAATDATNKANAVQTNLDAQTGPAAPTAVTLSPGLQSITASRRSRIRNIKMSGRTLVNLLGRDGGCESLATFTPQGTSPTLSTTQVKQGVNSIKCVSAAGAQSYLYKDFTYPLDTTKQYLFAAWVYIESFSAGLIGLRLYDVGGTVNNRYSKYATTTTLGSWQLVYLKIPTANTLVGNGFRLAFGAFSSGGADAVCYIDSMGLYEISSADSTAIDSMTAAQVAAKWPYVDDAKHTNAVYIQNAGKNLLPPFSDTTWAVNGNAVATGSYALTMTATAVFQATTCRVPALPGQTYTLSRANTSGNIYITAIDASGADIAGAVNSSGLSVSITTPSNTASLRVTWDNGNNSSGTFAISNPQLELGNTATTFEQKRGSYLYLPDPQLRSDALGTVVDSLYMDGEGKPRKTKRIEGLTLDGALSWSYGATYTGRKLVTTPVANSIVGATARAIDYTGRPLVSVYDGSVANVVYINPAFAAVLAVAVVDSGWGDAYTPSAAEIAAYFYGWKMYPSDTDGTGTAAYTGTGTKRWMARKADGTLDAANISAANTVPTTQAPGFTPYRLIYQLAASTDEALNYEGDLVLHEGGNQIEVGTGVVVREQAVVGYNPTGGGYYRINMLNHPSYTPNSALKNRALRMLAVYKNDVRDLKWSFITDTYAYGSAAAQLNSADYDRFAVYSVSYLALDTYALGIAPQTINADYASNQKEALDDVNRGVTDLRTAVSVLQAQKAGKQQTQLIAPTLLNGWTQYADLRYAPLGYYKDDFGLVRVQGMIGGGVVTTGTIIFKLPQAYRPAKNFKLVVSATNAYGEIEVTSDGNVIVASIITNTYVSLDTIVFKAAQ